MWDRLSAKIESFLGKEDTPPKVGLGIRTGNANLPPFKIEHSVVSSDVKVAKDNLRMMEVEQEILSHAIRRLYEIEANGEIDKSERDRLASRYKERMIQVKNLIQHDHSVVTLYNLECAQADLMEMFSKHLDDLYRKMGELKVSLGMEPVSTSLSEEKKEKKRKKRKRKKRSSAAEKSRVEERIGKIQAEVDKALGKLERIETRT